MADADTKNPKEKKAEEPKKEKKNVKVAANLKKIIDEVEKLSVLELSELVKALEDKFGVTAAAPVVAAAAGAAGGAEEGAAAEEKSEYNVVLASTGANKIAVIKAIREVKPDLGLKDAKDLADNAPKTILEAANKEQADDTKTKLEAAGAQVELK
jgi:large subunit ribosomal protein L7/L12